jgi:hypothetical protein
MMTTALTDIVVCVAASPVPQANIKEIEDAHQARRDADAANAEWGAKLKETCSNKLLVLQGMCLCVRPIDALNVRPVAAFHVFDGSWRHVSGGACLGVRTGKLDKTKNELEKTLSALGATEAHRDRLLGQAESNRQAMAAAEGIKNDTLSVLRQREAELHSERAKNTKAGMVRALPRCHPVVIVVVVVVFVLPPTTSA